MRRLMCGGGACERATVAVDVDAVSMGGVMAELSRPESGSDLRRGTEDVADAEGGVGRRMSGALTPTPRLSRTARRRRQAPGSCPRPLAGPSPYRPCPAACAASSACVSAGVWCVWPGWGKATTPAAVVAALASARSATPFGSARCARSRARLRAALRCSR